jgi:hypothetical protein
MASTLPAQIAQAIQAGSLPALQSILSTPANRAHLFTPDYTTGETLLDSAANAAASLHQPACLQLLLQHGARLEMLKTAELAMANAPTDIWQILLAHGLDLNAPIGEGETAVTVLRYAVGNQALVRWMLEHGADPRMGRGGPSTMSPMTPSSGSSAGASSSASSTAYAYTTTREQEEAVRLMASFGADLQYTDAFGEGGGKGKRRK